MSLTPGYGHGVTTGEWTGGRGLAVGSPVRALGMAARWSAALALLAGLWWVAGDRLLAVVPSLWLAWLPFIALVLPAVLVSAWLCAKRPVVATFSIFALMAFEGSARAFVPGAAPLFRPVIDLVLLGLGLALAWDYLVAGRAEPVRIWPGIVALAAYVFFTLAEIPLADSIAIGIQAFREAPSFILAFFVLAYARWTDEARWRMVQGAVVVLLLAGGYATLRMIIGPATNELLLASGFDAPSGEVAAIGSFTGRHVLGAWGAVAVPFCAAVAFGAKGRWRFLAAAAAILSSVAVLGSETRAGLVAAAAGLAALFVLALASRASAQLRAGVVIALVLSVPALYAGYEVTIGSSEGASARYERILRPSEDPAIQSRLHKWSAVIEDLKENPLGAGLGTAGDTQVETGRFANISNTVLDNSYLLVAQQQGYPGVVLLVLAMLAVLAGLALRVVTTRDRRRAAIGAGGVAAFLSFMVVAPAGNYLTTWAALLAWMLLGLAVGQFVAPRKTAAPRVAR